MKNQPFNPKNLRSIEYKGFAISPQNNEGYEQKLPPLKEAQAKCLPLAAAIIQASNQKEVRDANYRGFMNLL